MRVTHYYYFLSFPHYINCKIMKQLFCVKINDDKFCFVELLQSMLIIPYRNIITFLITFINNLQQTLTQKKKHQTPHICV